MMVRTDLLKIVDKLNHNELPDSPFWAVIPGGIVTGTVICQETFEKLIKIPEDNNIQNNPANTKQEKSNKGPIEEALEFLIINQPANIEKQKKAREEQDEKANMEFQLLHLIDATLTVYNKTYPLRFLYLNITSVSAFGFCELVDKPILDINMESFPVTPVVQ